MRPVVALAVSSSPFEPDLYNQGRRPLGWPRPPLAEIDNAVGNDPDRPDV